MLDSPELVVEEFENRPLEELLEERNHILKVIEHFEPIVFENDKSNKAWCWHPGPDMNYDFNLEYLSRLLDLIRWRCRKELYGLIYYESELEKAMKRIRSAKEKVYSEPVDYFPEEVRAFIDKQSWIFAKTYADKAPHEYIVRHKHEGTDEEFKKVVNYILDNGITIYFWNHPNKYIFVDGWQYWVMRDGYDDPSTILNRCNLEEYKLSINWKGKGEEQKNILFNE